ncbi:MAG TPA: hypothetical protein PLZ55_19630, partial [bacterium]|nr:hypothetical protein [bacterium]
MKNPIRFQINIALFVTLYAFFSYVVPPCSYGEYSSYRTFCPVTYSAAISPDGSRIAGGSDNPGFRVWDARTGELLGQFFHPHKDPISAVAFSGDSKYLATGDIGMDVSRILVWDLSTMEVVRTIEIPSNLSPP